MTPTQRIEAAKNVYDLRVNGGIVLEVVAACVGADDIQHNPDVADGKQAFIDYFDRTARE
jgi:predicted SnoaL-like aldol condensation-catalyzing enzyme